MRFQDESGMWHTLVDDPTSYVEASATCGFRIRYPACS